jgi:hypothetical protein
MEQFTCINGKENKWFLPLLYCPSLSWQTPVGKENLYIITLLYIYICTTAPIGIINATLELFYSAQILYPNTEYQIIYSVFRPDPALVRKSNRGSGSSLA